MNKSFLVYSSNSGDPRKRPILFRSFLVILCSLLAVSLGWWLNDFYQKTLKREFGPLNVPIIKPLEKYSIENLSGKDIKPSKIVVDKETKKTDKFSSYLFSFEFDPTLQNESILKIQNKTVTGLMNLPSGENKSPLVVLVRGYVDQSIYTSGMGSRRVGEYLAENGYITVAPDFLGYGGSDSESGNIFETRFQTYTTLLTLLKTISTDTFPRWDGKNIFIWAHSNGGQITLTSLAVTGATYPTVVWAPVTKPFPYSVLYYTDESVDGGKFIRKELSKFEELYDVDKYSMTNYLDKINAPIHFHLGTADDAIPQDWTDGFVKVLKDKGKDVQYFKHEGADHDMNPLWDEVIAQTLEYYNSKLIN